MSSEFSSGSNARHNRVAKFSNVHHRNIPAATRTRISCTPGPIFGIGFQSSGSNPSCTRPSSYPARRRATSGNARRSPREEPTNSSGFGASIKEIYNILYIRQVLRLWPSTLEGAHRAAALVAPRKSRHWEASRFSRDLVSPRLDPRAEMRKWFSGGNFSAVEWIYKVHPVPATKFQRLACSRNRAVFGWFAQTDAHLLRWVAKLVSIK